MPINTESKKRTNIFRVFLLACLFNILPAQSEGFFTPKNRPQISRDLIIGKIIKMNLESYHFRNRNFNDEMSKKAFKLYLDKIDSGKKFLLQKDIKQLKHFEKLIDDNLLKGDLNLVNNSTAVLKTQIGSVRKYINEILKKPFNFKLVEKLELDPDKRDYPKNKKELKEIWRKLLKNYAIGKYLSYKDIIKESKDTKKKTKKNKKDKEKKKTADEMADHKKLLKMNDKQLHAKVRKELKKEYNEYLDRLLKSDHHDELDYYINAVAGVYDPHTTYLPPRKKEDFDIDISGSLEGIGAVLQEEGSYIKVVKIVPGGAAWRQKDLKVNDKILKVTQQATGKEVNIVGMRVGDAVRYIRGKKGTKVKLTVKKSDNAIKNITITRDVVQVEESYAKHSILGHEKIKNKKFGYIKLPKFYRSFNPRAGNDRNCTNDIKKILKEFNKDKVNGVILDLRNNGGGSLEDAKLISGLFIGTGPIVQVKDNRNKSLVLADSDTNIQYKGPLIVMVNAFSASASEIVAGALKDYNRALIVGGKHTHGKGTVQNIIDLDRSINSIYQRFSPLGALKLTIQQFYRINGSSTQVKGVVPDIIFPDPLSELKSREMELDYHLPWDKISELPHKDWKTPPDIRKLKASSSKRIKRSSYFDKVGTQIKYYKKKKNDTTVYLNIQKVISEKKKNKKIKKVMDDIKDNKDMKVVKFNPEIQENIRLKIKDTKDLEKEIKLKQDNFKEKVQKDYYLEETLFILNEMTS
jgi:carboxyl-terminal processing protease